MTAPRYEVTGLDDRFCVGCGDITSVDAKGFCDECYAYWIGEDKEGRGTILRITLEAERATNKANRIAAADRQAYDWDPVKREEHCSNCRNCVVFEQDGEPMARCDKHLGRMDGEPRPLCFLTKPSSPYSWRAARKCPGFECMSDDCKGHV